MANKYQPLTNHLRTEFSKPGVCELRIPIETIAMLVGQLPYSSIKAGWWANSSDGTTPLPHVKAWQDADCFVYDATPKDNVSQITFHKGKSNQGNAFVPANSPQVTSAHLKTSWSWTELGEVSRGSLSIHPLAKMELQFPEPQRVAGIYCFRYDLNGQQYSYVGESDNLRRRLQQYRSATGSTEQHVEAALHAAIENANPPTLLVSLTAEAAVGGTTWQLDLSDSLVRVLVEHAAIACERYAGRTVINR